MKNVSKSIRISEKVYNYILSFDGDGFNQKFENIILFAMENENDLLKRISELEYIISQRNDELSILNNKLQKARMQTSQFLYAIRDLENFNF